MKPQELKKDQYFTTQEVDALLSSTWAKVRFGKSRYSYEKHTNYMLLCLLLKTGIRASEASSITIQQIKKGLSDGEFSMVGKGGMNTTNKEKVKKSTRQVLLNAELQGIIHAYMDKRNEITTESMYFLVGRTGNQLNQRTIHYRFQTICEQAGITPKKTHSTRHTFGMNVYGKTKDILTTSALLGHKDVRTTQVYVVATNEDKRNAIELI